MSSSFRSFQLKPSRCWRKKRSVCYVKEVVMLRSGRTMRKALLSEIFDVLERTYGLTLRRDEGA